MRKLTTVLVAGVLLLGATACSGSGSPAPEETASAVPGMDGEVEATIGTGTSESPTE